MLIAMYFKGRAGSLFELVNCPYGYVQTLKKMIDIESKNKKAQEQRAAEEISDEITGDN